MYRSFASALILDFLHWVFNISYMYVFITQVKLWCVAKFYVQVTGNEILYFEYYKLLPYKFLLPICKVKSFQLNVI